MEKDFDIEIKKYLTNGKKIRDFDYHAIPKEKGIYVVECPDGIMPVFEYKTTATHAKKLYTTEELQIKYKNGNGKILYIGCAPNKQTSKKRLFHRLSELMRFRIGKCKNHDGGKALWQIKNIDDMNIYWYSVDKARETEKMLLALHKEKYTVYPVANWQG